jgi:hypothetical protein
MCSFIFMLIYIYYQTTHTTLHIYTPFTRLFPRILNCWEVITDNFIFSMTNLNKSAMIAEFL